MECERQTLHADRTYVGSFTLRTEGRGRLEGRQEREREKEKNRERQREIRREK